MSLLAALNQAGVLRTLDDALARSLCRLDPKTPDKVAAAAALASMAVAHGHAGVIWPILDCSLERCSTGLPLRTGCICCAPVGGWPSHLQGEAPAPMEARSSKVLMILYCD